MKKTVVFFTLLISCVAMFAQSGPAFPYQAVVRNSQNQLIKDSTFAIGVEVYQGVDLKFSETQSVTTNANGQFTMNIGGGTVVSGAMGDVTDWSVAKFKVTCHLSEGDIVSENAVSPVPYALQAANNTALTELLNAMNARMDSLGRLVDSLSDLNHGGGTTAFTCGTSKVKDVDGNEYNTVQIGNQCWMAQNLRTKTHQYGNVWTKTDVDSAIYGRYYDWAAVMQGESGNTVQGICPTGWHVPSDVEWDTLTTYVNSVADYKCEGTNNYIAKALASKTGWNASGNSCAVGNNLEHNNATGFSVVPSGYYSSNNATCFNFGDYAFLWSATEGESGKVLCRVLNKGNFQVQSTNEEKNYGYSVRCVRDADTGGDTPATPATMSCEDVMNCLGDTLGRLNAKIENLQNTVARQDSTINALNNQVNPPFTCGTSTVKDVDNNEYNTVQIGNQCWTAKSLRTSNVNDKGIVYTPDYDVATYGLLYDWQAAMQIEQGDTTSYTGSDVNHKGICPKGWHVPSKAEWDTLTTYVSSVEAYKCNSSIASALSDSTGWKSSSICCAGDNSSATINITGFAAVPAGSFTDGFGGFGYDAYFWSATEYNNQMALCQSLHSLATGVSSYEDYKSHCYSVRCVRNADAGGGTPATPATMSCEDVMNCLGDTLGRLNARITSQGAEIETLNGTVASQANTIDSLNHIVDSLANPAPDTPASDTTAGPFNCGTDKVKDVDSNEYNTIQIGSQCWMKENLSTTTTIGNSWNPDGEVNNVDTYGLLYDWTAVMQVADANNTLIAVQDKHKGICPNGWHVPSQAEWETLSQYAFDNYRCTDCEEIDPIWQSDRADCVAKALCSAAWNDGGSSCNANSNAIGKNVTGFSILPAGARFGEPPGSFGTHAYFWSSTQHNGTTANSWFLGASASSLNSYTDNKPAGLSLRCVRD